MLMMYKSTCTVSHDLISFYSRTESNLEGSSIGSNSGSISPGAFQSCTDPLPIAIKNAAVVKSTAEETPNTNLHQPANYQHIIKIELN